MEEERWFSYYLFVLFFTCNLNNFFTCKAIFNSVLVSCFVKPGPIVEIPIQISDSQRWKLLGMVWSFPFAHTDKTSWERSLRQEKTAEWIKLQGCLKWTFSLWCRSPEPRVADFLLYRFCKNKKELYLSVYS